MTHTNPAALTGEEIAIDINSNPVSVTPVEHLDPARGLAANIGLSRVMQVADCDPREYDVAELEQPIIEFLEVCINDGITSETLKTLRPVQLQRLLEAALDGSLQD